VAKSIALVLAAAALAAVGAALWFARAPSPKPASALPHPVAADHVGSKACAGCHAREHEAWTGSHHALAMQEADAKSVLGNFDNARFSYAGVTSTFFRRDGKYFVRTDGADGKLADFEIKYTFGVTPLQQFLIEFPDGRLQALSIAWDARPGEQGGQRWFHLYPKERITHKDALHWTKLQQNWNFMCADCHSTNLKKNYDAATDSFKTAWSEINVGCEACHGPASNHVTWAQKKGDWKRFDAPGKGFAFAYDERKGVAWTMNAETGNASRSRARTRAKFAACDLASTRNR
jgi:hypothetical protein